MIEYVLNEKIAGRRMGDIMVGTEVQKIYCKSKKEDEK